MEKQRFKTFITFGLVSLLIVAFLVVVPVSAVLNAKDSSNRQNNIATTDISPLDISSNFSGLVIFANVTGVDPLTYTCKLQFLSYPEGSLATSGSSLISKLSVPITVNIERARISFRANESANLPEITVPILFGDINKYPYDDYQLDFGLFVSATLGNTTEFLPISLQVAGAIQGWSIIPYVNQVGTDYQVLLEIERHWTTKFFSIFINCIMWGVSISFMVLASTLWIRDRKVEPPTLGAAIGLLFALPAIRNSQPGIPVIGCTADLSSFLWAMVLATFAAVLLIWNYIIKYQRETPKQEPAPLSVIKVE